MFLPRIHFMKTTDPPIPSAVSLPMARRPQHHSRCIFWFVATWTMLRLMLTGLVAPPHPPPLGDLLLTDPKRLHLDFFPPGRWTMPAMWPGLRESCCPVAVWAWWSRPWGPTCGPALNSSCSGLTSCWWRWWVDAPPRRDSTQPFSALFFFSSLFYEIQTLPKFVAHHELM